MSALLLVAAHYRRDPRRGEIAGWLFLGLVTFGLASTSAFTRWPHHFVFPALFLVLALARALDLGGRWAGVVAGILVFVLWASLAVRWSSAVYPRDSTPGKDELLSFVREKGLDRDMFQVHSSWGTYYVAQLFGDPERMVVFVKGIPDDSRQLKEVACLARERGRRLLLISSRRWRRIQTSQVDDVLSRPAQTWRFGGWWAVAYETDGVEGCGSSVDPPAERATVGVLREDAERRPRSGLHVQLSPLWYAHPTEVIPASDPFTLRAPRVLTSPVPSRSDRAGPGHAPRQLR
jgi:hypothetical protein